MGMSERAVGAKSSVDRVTAYFSQHAGARQDPDALDFTFGNPHEMALPGLTDAMRAQLEPRSVDWYAYKSNERPAQEAVAAGLSAELGLDFEPDDIAMTQGAFGAIALALALVADAGDEVSSRCPGGSAMTRCCSRPTWSPYRRRWTRRTSRSTSMRSHTRSRREHAS